MFTYISLGTNNLSQATQFYDAVMGSLGITRCDVSQEPDWEGWIGWGIYEGGGAREMALWICEPFDGKPASVGNGSMIALSAKSWNAVNDFYKAALANGGSCEGKPGLRKQYAPDFYAAYVRDVDGNKLAAVCRGFQQLQPT